MDNMELNTDQILVEQTLAGDTRAFGTLVSRYQDFIFTIALRIVKSKEEAEEVAQDTFIKAFESLSGYRGEAKFSSWLYSIAYRKALDRVRKNKRTRSLELVEDVTEKEVETIDNALHYLQDKERKDVIQQSILALPEQEAAIITLYYFEDQSVREISEITQLTEDNIKVKLYRSRKKLFTLLKQYVLPEISDNNGKAI